MAQISGRRMRVIVLWPLLAGVSMLSACGGGDDDGNAGHFSVRFKLTRGGMTVECKDVPEVKKVRVKVLRADGITALKGYPREADCASGRFDAEGLPAEDLKLEITAHGMLGGEPDAVLFRGTRPIDSADIEIAMVPEVATLALSWSFGEAGSLAPCQGEVDRVSVTISTGAGGAGFARDYPCTGTPVTIPAFFAPRMYFIELTASSPEGFPLYQLTENRVLTAGENRFDAVLLPQGGRLLFDWQFAIEAAAVQNCDNARVAVTEVIATVRRDRGEEPIEERISCNAPRPYAFRAARFVAGRQLQLELVAEGAHRFKSVRAFTMPANDHEIVPALTMFAVGTATVTFTMTATCAARTPDEVRLGLSLEGVVPAVELPLPSGARSQVVEDIPYGEWSLVLRALASTNEVCKVEGRRRISGRANDWAPFSL